MRTGVSFPSYAAEPTYAMVTGAAASGFPLSNLASLYNLRTPFQASASGIIAFTWAHPTARTIQFLGLLHHNGPAAATVRYRLFSDNNPDPVGNAGHMVLDTGALAMVASSIYPQCFPYKLAAPTSIQSGRVDLSSNAVAWLIGALEIAGWWEWQDIGFDRSLGLGSNDTIVQQPFNIDHTMSSFSPRTWQGNRALTDQSENLTTMQDFQLATKTNNPFVFCWDISDSNTFERQCFVARNASLIAPVMNDYPGGTQSFSFQEHMR